MAADPDADAAPVPEMARHLVWLREQLGDDFIAGVLLHTGPRPFRIEEGIYALPISSLWSSSQRTESRGAFSGGGVSSGRRQAWP